MALELGQQVKLVQPVIQGEIVDIQYVKENRSLEMLVEFQEDGETQQRWFTEAQLEAV